MNDTNLATTEETSRREIYKYILKIPQEEISTLKWKCKTQERYRKCFDISGN